MFLERWFNLVTFLNASTAVWERSLGSISCLLLVVQRILFDPSRLDQFQVTMHVGCLVAQVVASKNISKCGSFSHTHISSCLDTEILALPTTQSHDSTNTECDKYSHIFFPSLFFSFFRSVSFFCFFFSFLLIWTRLRRYPFGAYSSSLSFSLSLFSLSFCPSSLSVLHLMMGA